MNCRTAGRSPGPEDLFHRHGETSVIAQVSQARLGVGHDLARLGLRNQAVPVSDANSFSHREAAVLALHQDLHRARKLAQGGFEGVSL